MVCTDFVLNGIAFLPLLASQFQPVREIGWLMGFMLLSCAVGALIFVPSALPLAVKKQEGATEALRYEKESPA